MLRHAIRAGAEDTEAAQIVELAVTLPLLMVLFVGIYDFGSAFNIKQKLSGAAREGARFAASQSTLDLTSQGANCADTAPDSICSIRDVVQAYMIANKINDCGVGNIASAPPTQTAGTWIWTFTAAGCPGGSFTLTINRGFTFTVGSGGSAVTVEATKVSVSYPYQWQFSRVIRLVVPSASFAAASQIPTEAVMQNLN